MKAKNKTKQDSNVHANTIPAAQDDFDGQSLPRNVAGSGEWRKGMDAKQFHNSLSFLLSSH